jgi:molybdopterin-guanine dinucleotide biosynthesis protein MobB
MIEYPLPLIGFSAFSGTGKTTLLIQLLPILKAQKLRIGMVKHAHHHFDIDHPGKDSYELRKAGAEQMLIASRRRMALVREYGDDRLEPVLPEVLNALDPSGLDLVLVEGFKDEPFPKIELHRPSMGKPLLYPDDPNIIAIATDAALPEDPARPRLLELNDPEAIATFVLAWLQQQ